MPMALCDADELLHEPPDPLPARWQENMFFICWDTCARNGFISHVRRAPQLGFQEAQVVVAVEGVVGSAWLEGPFDPQVLVPGMAAIPLEPFRRWSLRLDCAGVAGAGPMGFVAAARGGETALAVDLTLESELPVADFADGLAAVVAGMRATADGPQMGDQQHYEQGGTWRGRLCVGDRESEVSGLFVRDHSWGIRDEHQHFEAFWTASCLDEGRLFCNAIGVPTPGGVVGIGAVVDPSGVVFTDDVSAAFTPAAGVGTYDATTVAFGPPVARTLTAETQLHVPIYLPRSGPGRYDNNALSTVHMDGMSGFGVMEWASVLTGAELETVTAGARVS
jgi:hypothetical protein